MSVPSHNEAMMTSQEKTCREGAAISGNYCGDHCHGWCLLSAQDGITCPAMCDTPTGDPIVIQQGRAVYVLNCNSPSLAERLVSKLPLFKSSERGEFSSWRINNGRVEWSYSTNEGSLIGYRIVVNYSIPLGEVSGDALARLGGSRDINIWEWAAAHNTERKQP